MESLMKGWSNEKLSMLHGILSLPVNRSNSQSALKFIICSILVHVLLFCAIFDIYFTSPVVTNIDTYHRPEISKPPARRLVFIVSDGLRAQSLFPNNLKLTPFFHDVVNRRGGWGVSHTQVPTESRPGHVALIAGIYEDVASVTRGWQENAVEFDSLFNRSRSTWSWGSPDIIHMFARGAVPGRVHFHSYSGNKEDFAGSDLTALDTWVFDRVSEFLNKASKTPTLNSRLNDDGLVFFLHLLGVDSTGHSWKPRSKEYSDNIAVVDEGVRKIEQLFENFYGHDHQTAYVFTADHGMTDWGSHGAGLDHETWTPLITWGAGFRGPITADKAVGNSWSIPAQRNDVNQADICPLMAAVLGLSFPVNSVGKLPLNFLNVTVRDRMRMMRANALQIVEQFRKKRLSVKESSLSAFFKEFYPLTPSSIESQLRDAIKTAKSGQFAKAIEMYQQLVDKSIEGLYYYHRYDRVFSGFCISSIFLLWITCLLFSIAPNHNLMKTPSSDISFTVFEMVFFFSLILTQVTVLIAEFRPFLQWMYRLVPIYMLWSVFRHRPTFSAAMISFHGIFGGFIIIIGLELLIWSFFYRYLLCMVVILHCVWHSFLIKTEHNSDHSKFVFQLSSLALCIFPLLPVIGSTVSLWMVPIGPLISCIIVILFLISKRNEFHSTRNLKLIIVQIMLNIFVCVIHYASHISIKNRNGLPMGLQIASWVILLFSFLIVFDFTRSLNDDLRQLHVWLSVTAMFTLLSIFYETVFLLVLYSTINSWIVMQSAPNERQSYINPWLTPFLPAHSCFTKLSTRGNFDKSVMRICFSYVVFLMISFFGTGNIASINSFDPRSVYCFLTVFRPFLMGALMMMKIVLPMLLTSCLFFVIVNNIEVTLLSRVAMILADFMALHFFFLIRDWGSWLEIGTSISHYVISMANTVVVVVFLSLSRYLLRRNV